MIASTAGLVRRDTRCCGFGFLAYDCSIVFAVVVPPSTVHFAVLVNVAAFLVATRSSSFLIALLWRWDAIASYRVAPLAGSFWCAASKRKKRRLEKSARFVESTLVALAFGRLA